MRVLTTSLVEYPPLLKILGLKESNPFCGWVFAASQALIDVSKDLTLGVVSIAPSITKFEKYEYGQYVFYRIPSKGLQRIEKKEIEAAHEIINDFRPDLIHLNGTEYSLGLEIISANSKDVPVVASIQGLAFVCERYNQGYIDSREFIKHYSFRDIVKNENQFKRNNIMKERGLLEIETLKKIDHVIGRTEWDKVHTMTINPNLAYHFCNETLRACFYTAKKWRYESCKKYSIFCSNGSLPLKGLHFLLRAVAIVKQKYPSVELRVAGPNVLSSKWKDRLKLTSYHKYLRFLIKDLALENNIEFLGFLNQDNMVNEYQKCNVYVLPSCIENSPNSLCEAQIIGTPCISSICGGTQDFIDDDIDGFLYRCEEWEMLADRICLLFSNPLTANNMSQKAILKAQVRHDVTSNAESLLNIYKDILKHE